MQPTFTFTLDSNALVGDDWHEDIGHLLEVNDHCLSIDLARTTGALREVSAGPDREAAGKRALLIERLRHIPEVGVYGMGTYGDGGVYGGPKDQEHFDAIKRALWPNRASFDRSEINDAMHLSTHLRYRRSIFVTTDGAMHNANDRLAALGIRVMRPAEALKFAQEVCQSVGVDG
jgi:hypothetical protein